MKRTTELTARTRRSALVVGAILAAAVLAWCFVQLTWGENLAFGSGAAVEAADGSGATGGSDAASAAGGRCAFVVDGDGEEHLIPLDEEGTYTFATSLGTNTVEVADGAVRMTSADCPGHDCIEQGAIHDAAGVIVCMPHHLIVTVVDGESCAEENDAEAGSAAAVDSAF